MPDNQIINALYTYVAISARADALAMIKTNH